MNNKAIKHEKPPNADEITRFIFQCGANQRQASECAGVSLRTMQRYVAGHRVMTTQTWAYMRRNMLQRRDMVDRGALKAI